MMVVIVPGMTQRVIALVIELVNLRQDVTARQRIQITIDAGQSQPTELAAQWDPHFFRRQDPVFLHKKADDRHSFGSGLEPPSSQLVCVVIHSK